MAATPIYQSSGIMDHRSLRHAYDKTMDKIIEISDNVPREGAPFVQYVDSQLETYREGQISSVLEVPERNEDTARIPILQAVEGYAKTFTNIQRRSGILVSERAVRTQKTQAISKMMKGLPKSAERLEELAIAKLFNDGFATETTADGSYVFATDHYHEDPSAGQYSNVSATNDTFTTSSFFAGWLNMQNRKNEKGFTDFMIPGQVLYPPAIHEAVMKVHGSDKYPQDSLNAKMPELFGAFEPKLMHWLTSTTNWFIHAKADEADKGFRFIWELRPNYMSLSDGMNPDMIMGKRLKLTFAVGAVHGKDWYANNGA